MLQIDFGINSSPLWGVEKIGDERDRVAILPADLVEASVVNTEAERPVLFLNKKDRGPTRRSGWADETVSEVFLYELAKSLEFGR